MKLKNVLIFASILLATTSSIVDTGIKKVSAHQAHSYTRYNNKQHYQQPNYNTKNCYSYNYLVYCQYTDDLIIVPNNYESIQNSDNLYSYPDSKPTSIFVYPEYSGNRRVFVIPAYGYDYTYSY
jgi:hypothetical protein